MLIRDSQMQAMADTAPGQQIVAPCDATKTWVEVCLVDRDNKPVPGEAYRIRLPDSSLMEGTLDGDGKVRFEAIVAGQCSVCFPNIDSKEWKPI